MIARVPLRFRPYFKTVIWGGDKICSYKGVDQNEPNIGESWEISAVPGHESVVEEGVYEGLKLTDLIASFGESLLGDTVFSRYGGAFPLLVKLIDANDNLSVQVHPDDALARKRHGCLGKTEMWYIISADEGAKIYAGLNREITPEEYAERVSNDTFTEVLATHDSFPGDVFFLPAGRVHAIGAGNLLAEIQESSDITYRIYDYGRRDKDGNPRELHTEQARDAIDYKVYPDYKSEPVGADKPYAELASCEHFTTHRMLLDGEAELNLDFHSFTILMCVEGETVVKYPEGEMTLTAGRTVLIPAALNVVGLRGHATLLISRVS